MAKTEISAKKPLDVVALAQSLISRPSVTPADAGAMDVAQRALEALGFACTRLKFDAIENLYARRGTTAPNLCFAGHTDVVPSGARNLWKYDPFGAEVHDGVLIGRGAVDMKGAIAAWIAAVSRLGDPAGSLSFLITGDEEGDAVNGTKKVVEYLKDKGEIIDHCIVGEPTSVSQLGDMIKVGRRGSLNASFTVIGKQGHVAYPDRALNPLPVLVNLLADMQTRVLDKGYEGFPPSNLEITSIDTGNPTSNIIPAQASARINIRFNPTHTGTTLNGWLLKLCEKHAHGTPIRIDFKARVSGEAFLTEPGDFVDLILDTIRTKLRVKADPSTSGGTSDARFIRELCPVVEFGLVGQTMHQVNEAVRVADLHALSDAYQALIEAYFSKFEAKGR